MAGAIIGVDRRHLPTDIEVVEISRGRRTCLRVCVVTHTDLSQARLHALIVLAVKPQALPEVAAALAPCLASHLVVSIAAGVRVADLARWLGGHTQIVRAMPNTPALVRRDCRLHARRPPLTTTRSRARRCCALSAAWWVDDEPSWMR
jgi:pyrroline-5-carboxylate reductase